LLKVKDCLKDSKVSLKRGTPLKEIIILFKEKNCQLLPVVDGENKLVGKISLDEITTVFQPQSAEISKLLETIPFIDTVPEADLDIENITPEMGILVVADEIMSKNYFTAHPEDSVAKAFSLMKLHDTAILLIVDNDNKLEGVLTMFDIIYSMFREKGVIK